MPDYDLPEEGKEPAGDPDDEILKQALEDFTEAQDGDTQREQRKEDLRFALGDSDNDWQWPEELLRLRKSPGTAARPCLTINKVAEHIRQVTNDQRQNKPSVKVRPANEQAHPDAAEVYAGIIRHIEYASDAQTAYNTACDHQVPSGLGYFRILTEYCADDSFDQDIRIKRVLNPYSVWDDPYIQTPEGSDRRYAFIVDDMPREKFEQDYPDVDAAGWQGDETTGWVTKDSVRVAEYFYYEYKKRELIELATGATMYADEATPEMLKLVARRRDVEVKSTKWCKLTGFKVLDKKDFPSQYIGLIRVVADEWEIDGERVIKGLVRNAKDPQRLFNYYRSSEAEVIGQQPKSPFIGYQGQFDGHEVAWKLSNVSPQAYLEVNPVPDSVTGQVLPLPQRQPPPQISPAFIQGAANASDDIKSSTGQYDPSLGNQRSQERSGIALQRLESRGDTSTYHYGDNLAKGIGFGGVIMIDMIPRVYTAKRLARILGEDGSDSFVQLDPNQKEAVSSSEPDESGAIKKVYNLAVGRYDVAVTVGPSYTTKRMESQDFMTQLAKAYPPIMQQAGDIIIRNFDVPGADRLADRLKKFISPQVTQDEGTDQNDPKAMLGQMQQQQQLLEQGLQQAHQLYEQSQQAMQQMSEENAHLKLKNANKQGEIDVKHEAIAADLIMAEIKANAVAQNASIQNAFQHFATLLQSMTAHNQMDADMQQTQMQNDAQAQQAQQAQQARQVQQTSQQAHQMQLAQQQQPQTTVQ